MDLKLGKCPEELIMTRADSKKIIELNANETKDLASTSSCAGIP